MMKNILELSTTKALDYFLQPASYSTLSLPIYFSFDKILRNCLNLFIISCKSVG